MTLNVRAATDTGLKRARNEDSLAYWCSDVETGRGTLMVVADGMGGSRAGEVASQLAVHAVVDSYRESSDGEPLETLHKAVETANARVHRQSLANPDLRGMGTTCTAVLVRERHAFFAHVGDSRAYVVQRNGIRQITRDHSLVAQLVQSQQITPEQARVDPRRNLVTRSVGVGQTVEIDADRLEGTLAEGDTLMLCTDGLHGLVTDEELAALIADHDLDEACNELVALARRRGGPDNITVLLARMESSPDTVTDGEPCFLPPRDAA